jgi:DNA modification methylase
MWSNAGETVLTPFMGVGSEVYGAVSLGRRGVGAELKPAYFRQAVRNVAAAGERAAEVDPAAAKTTPDLFDEVPQ